MDKANNGFATIGNFLRRGQSVHGKQAAQVGPSFGWQVAHAVSDLLRRGEVLGKIQNHGFPLNNNFRAVIANNDAIYFYATFGQSFGAEQIFLPIALWQQAQHRAPVHLCNFYSGIRLA